MSGEIRGTAGGSEVDVRDHVILCGAGLTGRAALEELSATGRPFVVIERDVEACDRLGDLVPAGRVVVGDATEESVLRKAGVGTARVLIAALHDDKQNLVITVTALNLRRELRVVARCGDVAYFDRLRRAGAAVVSPEHIGGRRLAAGLIHPAATTFLSEMLATPSDPPVRVESVVVGPGTEADGNILGRLEIYARTGLHVVAHRSGAVGAFHYNPSDDTMLHAGDRLIVIGDWVCVQKLARLVGGWE